MSTLKIRGGDLDLVEYEFSSFNPGENINVNFPGRKKEYDLVPSPDTVSVSAPGRIHLSVLDMNRFAPGHPGGGAIGFALKIYSHVSVKCTTSAIKINYGRPELIRHFISVFSKAVNYTGGFDVAAIDHSSPHVGLGTTCTILITLAVALNKAVGSPLSDDDLRFLVGNNYVEETDDNKVIYGFETGVGPAVTLKGGMAVMGDDLTIVYQHSFAEGKKVYIVIPSTDISSAGEEEFALLMNKARILDYRDREQKAYCVLMDFIPALQRGNIAKMGDIIWEIEFRGSKRAEIEHHSFEIYQYIHNLRKAGFQFAGMSSVGPSIVIITDEPVDAVESILTPLGLKIAITTAVDNRGIFFD